MSDPPSGPSGASTRRDPARQAPARGFAQSVMFSAARGAALIGLAVIVGIVLLQVVDNGSNGPIGDHGTGGSAAAPTTRSTTTTTTKRSATTTTTTRAARAPAQVTVQVLNGSGQVGAARALTQRLQSQGYQAATPNDTGGRQGTVVYSTTGYDAEAAAAAAFVGNGAQAAAMPSPAPENTDASANLVVVIGG